MTCISRTGKQSFALNRSLGSSFHFPFHQQEWDKPPVEWCPIGSAPSSKSKAPVHHTDPPGLQEQFPHQGRSLWLSTKSPCSYCASYLCPFPSLCPIITLLNCTAVGTFIFRLVRCRL